MIKDEQKEAMLVDELSEAWGIKSFVEKKIRNYHEISMWMVNEDSYVDYAKLYVYCKRKQYESYVKIFIDLEVDKIEEMLFLVNGKVPHYQEFIYFCDLYKEDLEDLYKEYEKEIYSWPRKVDKKIMEEKIDQKR